MIACEQCKRVFADQRAFDGHLVHDVKTYSGAFSDRSHVLSPEGSGCQVPRASALRQRWRAEGQGARLSRVAERVGHEGRLLDLGASEPQRTVVRTRTVVEVSRTGDQKFVFHRLANGMTLNHPDDPQRIKLCPECSRRPHSK